MENQNQQQEKRAKKQPKKATKPQKTLDLVYCALF